MSLSVFIFEFWLAPLGNLFPRPGRLAIASGLKNASSCLFAEANRKENIRLSRRIAYQTVIFQRGDPIDESTRLLLPNARKSKSNSFVNTFLTFFDFFLRLGKNSAFWSVFGIFRRSKTKRGSFPSFENPSATAQVFYQYRFCNDVAC